MPNTLTTIFRTVPSTEPVEAPHPNTGVYVTGTQLADGTWQVVHTLITKTSSPLTMTGRLKNFPAITASIVANGNILNIQQPAPTGTSATGSSSTSINVTGSSGANATAYRFYSSAAQAGPFTVLVTQASATYANTGLSAGAVMWYQMQYVGGGFYDDSAQSAVFSGTAAAAAVASGSATYYNTPSRAYSAAYQLETSSAYAGGAGSYTTQIGAYYNDTFTGTGLDISTPVGPGKGNADVYIDNVKVATVTATAGANANSQVLAVTNGSLRGFAPGSHTVRVVNLGGGSANVLISDKLQGIA